MKRVVFLLVYICFLIDFFGQSNPAPHDLSSSNYTFTGFADGTTTAYPASMQGWSFSAERTSANLIGEASNDRVLAQNTTGITTGSIRNEIINGISLLNSGTNHIGAIVIAVNTLAREDIMVTWTAEQINSGGTGATDRINGLLLQYRIGVSGDFTSVTGTEYITNQLATQEAPQTFSSIILPAEVNNNPVVQIRWIYYIHGGSANARDRIRLDDINIASIASVGCTAPTIQPNTLTFSSVTATSGQLNWVDAGNGNGQLVVMRAGSAVTATPVSGTAYTSNAAFGSGTDLGSAEYVVYKGDAGPVNVTNLLPNTTYHVAIFEYNTTGDCFLTSNPLTGSFTTPCNDPTVQATLFTSSAINTTTATMGWTRGNGNQVLVVARSGGAVNADPIDGTNYTANAAFSTGGSQIGTGNWVVYSGTGNSVNLTNLTQGTTYHFAIYEFSTPSNCYNETQLTGNLTTLVNSEVAFTSSSANISETSGSHNLPLTVTYPSSVQSTSVTIELTSGDASLVSEFAAVGSTLTVVVPANMSSANELLTIVDNADCAGPATLIFTITAVSGGQGTPIIVTPFTYQLTISDDEQTVGNIKSCFFDGPDSWTYTGGTVVSGNGSFPAAPLYVSPSNGLQVNSANQNIDFAQLNASIYEDLTLSFRLASFSGTSGNGADGDDYAQVAISVDGGTTWSNELRVNGNSNAQWSFAGGTGVASTAYDGDNTNTVFAPSGGGVRTTDGYSFISLSGIPNSSTLRVRITLRNNNSDEMWVIDNVLLTGKKCVCTKPTIAPTNFSTTNLQATQAQLNWTAGNGNSQLVILSASPITAVPEDGIAYSGNAAFGSGSSFGNGQFAVYTGNGGPVVVTGLQVNTTYYAAVYEYNTAENCYFETSPLLSSFTTLCNDPTVQATLFTSSAITSTTATVGWTRGNGNQVLVVARAGGAVDADPVDGTDYTANAAFGSGTQIGTGNFVVYKGTGTLVNLTGLTQGTTYHFAIYEFSTPSNCYNEVELTGSFTTRSSLSDIISLGGESASIPTSNVLAGPLTATQGLQVWQFAVRDGGGISDGDNLPTIVTAFTVTQNSGNTMNDWATAIQSVDIFDGTTHIATGVVTANTITFSGINIIAPDNGSKIISMRLSLNCPATNLNNSYGDDFVFQISQGNVTVANTGSSQFTSFPVASSTNGQNVLTAVSSTITSITPTSGPVNTLVTINATGGGLLGTTAVAFNSIPATSFSIISDTQIQAIVAPGSTTGNITLTNGNCATSSFSSFVVITQLNSGCEGASIMTELIISEVTDASRGSYTFVELYNGTGAAINLSNYTLIQRTNGTTNAPITLLGTLANNSTYIVRVGADGSACDAASLPSGYPAVNQIESGVSGVNNNDCFILQKSGVDIDIWGECDGSVWVINGDAGYNYIRKPTIVSPNTTYTSTEWIITDWLQGNCSDNDYASVGPHSGGNADSPIITTQPGTTVLCASESTALTVAATEGFPGGVGLAYQWYVSAPNSAGWTALTNSGVYSGVTSAVLNISSVLGLDNYQYYCQISENIPTCYTASNSVQLDILGGAGTSGLWTGAISTDWFNCANWDDFTVPDATVDVTINQSAANNCIVSGGTASCNSLTISSNSNTNRNLEVQSTGILNITNGITVNKISGTGTVVVSTTGTGVLNVQGVVLNGSTTGVYDAVLRNESATATLNVDGNLLINNGGMLDLNPNGILYLQGNYLNNHNATAFDEATSTVVFDGVVDQNINANNFTEFFHDIILNKSGSSVQLLTNTTLDGTGVLTLNDGYVLLNGRELRLNNPLASAINRTTGGIVDESGSLAGVNAGKISWSISSNLGAHVYPFSVSPGGSYIPFTFDLTAGNAGIVTVSTYGTGADNTPWPSFPQTVTNLNSVIGLLPDNRTATVDRFWQIDPLGAPTANLTFTYQASELPESPYNDPTTMIAQRYNTALNQWVSEIIPGQISSPYTVTVPGVTTFSPWTLANLASPLPAELIAFDATALDKSVDIRWTTASEINVDYFDVQRSQDGYAFHTIVRQKAAGNSSVEQYYTALDDRPLSGMSYYRLNTIDFDGSAKLSDVRPVYFVGNGANAYLVHEENQWAIYYTGVNQNELTIEVFDASGKMVHSQKVQASDGGLYLSNHSFEKGIYLIRMLDGHHVISLKAIR
jgi:hypothetical protein